MSHSFIQNCFWIELCKFLIIKDERLVSKMEGKTNFLRRAWNSLTAWPDWPRPSIFYDRSAPLIKQAVRVATQYISAPCKLTISLHLFARWHLFRHVCFLRHQQVQQVDLWPFDLESVVRVTCDVGYLCANFSLPRPLCSRVRPDVRRLMPSPYGERRHNNKWWWWWWL